MHCENIKLKYKELQDAKTSIMLTFRNLICRLQQGKYARKKKKHKRHEKHNWSINNNGV